MTEDQMMAAIQKYFKESNAGKNEENSPIADLPFDVSKDLEQFSKLL